MYLASRSARNNNSCGIWQPEGFFSSVLVTRMTDGELTHMPYCTSISAAANLARIELMILGPRQLGDPIQTHLRERIRVYVYHPIGMSDQSVCIRGNQGGKREKKRSEQ